MMHIVFKNTQASAKKLGCSRSTIYSWLNGNTPKVKYLIRIQKNFKIQADLLYFYLFFSLAQAVKDMEYDRFVELLHISSLSAEDKRFLKDIARKKIKKIVDGVDIEE